MWIWKLLFCILLFASQCSGCHHGRKPFPPDEYPINGGNQQGQEGNNGNQGDNDIDSRKKRSLSSDPEAPHDADKELVAFFAKCMFEKTGKAYDSWTSVIAFILRDTRWYSSTDEQYCKENTDKDPKSLSCWKGRLKSLVKLNSKLLPKAEECLDQFDFQYGFEKYDWRRKKRDLTYTFKEEISYPSHPSVPHHPPPIMPPMPPQLQRCPVVSPFEYGKCVVDGLLTTANLAKFPSLKGYDEGSVRKFVTEEYSNCRIGSNVIRGENVYSERCIKPVVDCYPVVLNQIVRTPSPLFGSSTQCSLKYSAPPDPCHLMKCPPNEHCKDGSCVCNEDYYRTIIGICKHKDPCHGVICTKPHTHCVDGECVCRSGYVLNKLLHCVLPNPCDGKLCGPHSTCNPFTGICECHEGYINDPVTGWCVAIDPCYKVFCGPHSTCDSETGKCECDKGYKKHKSGRCVELCYDVRCYRNQHCVNGLCVCKPGYHKGPFGNCVGCKSPKVFKTCASACPKTCDNYNKPPEPCIEICLQKCVCPDNMVQKSKADETCVYPHQCDPCWKAKCPEHSYCKKGKCFCNKGFHKDRDGNCIRCKNPKVFDKCATACPKNCDNLHQPLWACPAICLQKCVCPPHMIERSATDHRCVYAFQCPDKCYKKICPHGSYCKDGKCICKDGYEKDKYGKCKYNKCYKKVCLHGSYCKDGKCICKEGYDMDEYGKCKYNKCYKMNCSGYGRVCVDGECVCGAGYWRYGPQCISLFE